MAQNLLHDLLAVLGGNREEKELRQALADLESDKKVIEVCLILLLQNVATLAKSSIRPISDRRLSIEVLHLNEL